MHPSEGKIGIYFTISSIHPWSVYLADWNTVYKYLLSAETAASILGSKMEVFGFWKDENWEVECRGLV
jgi:hypothetical protein